MVVYNEQIGEMTIDQNGRKWKIGIHRGNCLAVFVSHGFRFKEDGSKEYVDSLYLFFADEKHVSNIAKHYDSLFGDKVVSIKLNMFYKESMKLMKLLTKHGYKVTCYYKEVKNG